MSAASAKGTVGIVGLGIMGGSIAKNLSAAGWQVIGFDIEKKRCDEAEAAGVAIAKSAADVAGKATSILISLPKPEALAATVEAIANAKFPRRVIAELRDLFPPLKDASLLRVKVITDQHATFSAAPGVDGHRPSQQSSVPNLLLAGDWTATGWPATMEGAVRSGYLAAEALLKNLGRTVKCLQPDLC